MLCQPWSFAWDKERRTIVLVLPELVKGATGLVNVRYWKNPGIVNVAGESDLVPVLRVDEEDRKLEPKKIFDKYTPDLFAELFYQISLISKALEGKPLSFPFTFP